MGYHGHSCSLWPLGTLWLSYFSYIKLHLDKSKICHISCQGELLVTWLWRDRVKSVPSSDFLFISDVNEFPLSLKSGEIFIPLVLIKKRLNKECGRPCRSLSAKEETSYLLKSILHFLGRLHGSGCPFFQSLTGCPPGLNIFPQNVHYAATLGWLHD